MISFFIGLLIGYLLSIPVGPVSICIVKTKLTQGALFAFAVAFGESFVGFFYIFFIMSGLSFFEFHPDFVLFLKFCAVLVLFAFGLYELFRKHVVLSNQVHSVTKKSIKNYFLLGVLFYVINPTLVLTLTSLCTFVKSYNFFAMTFLNNVMFALGCGIGIFLWGFSLIRIIHSFQRRITQKILLIFSRVCGGCFILFSLYMSFLLYRLVG